MPCEVGPPYPDGREIVRQERLALIYNYLKGKVGAKIGSEVALCDFMKAQPGGERHGLISDASSKGSRALADWWEEHLENDRKREQEEAAQAEEKRLRKSGLSKLTSAERRSLGV